MNILIPTLGFGHAGGNRVLSELANSWIKFGHNVSFLCPDSSDMPHFPTIAEIIWVNGDGHTTLTRPSKSTASGWYHLKSLFRGLNEIGDRYDIILANHSFTAWPVALARCGNAKKTYYVQAYEPEYYWCLRTVKGCLLAIFSAGSYHLPLQRIVNSPIYFRKVNLTACDWVPPGINLEVFRPSNTETKSVDQEVTVIGCVGRQEPTKGTVYVLRAFEALYKLDKRYILRVAYGNLPDGWHHEHCEVVVPTNDQELAAYYRSLDILVAPGTVQHGAPHYPVLEGGACGAAVVTTGYLGATRQTAWIVENKNAASIVAAVREITADHSQRMQKRKRFLDEIQQFSWPDVAGKMLDIFQKNR